MRNIHIDYTGTALNYFSASLLAKNAAKENFMKRPTIISWHQHSGAMPAFYEGANPDTWWEKFGEGNGGKLEISIGDDFEFVMMDTRGYETLDVPPLRNVTDSLGNQYLCHVPKMQNDSVIEPKYVPAFVPTDEMCTKLD